MGRHGGGSRSGGRSGGSRSGDGSRSSGAVATIASAPFQGCYNRSYYYRGRYHSCYTNDKAYGTSKSRLIGKFLLMLLIMGAMLMLVLAVASVTVHVGEKVNGDPDRIMIQDTMDLLTPEEEQRTLELFREVYDASGMPVTLYTDDMEWNSKYSSLEVYSEELYYAMGVEEDAMLILFTYDGTFEWVYDVYCGDDTIRCLSDPAFEKLLDAFQKGMAGQDLCAALEHAFHSVMDDLAKTSVDKSLLGVLVGTIAVFGLILWFGFFRPFAKEWRAYKYFRENPESVEQKPILVKPQCPSCGAHNSKLLEVCEYCGTVLTL